MNSTNSTRMNAKQAPNITTKIWWSYMMYSGASLPYVTGYSILHYRYYASWPAHEGLQ